MPVSSRADHHLNLNYLPQIQANQPRSGASTANTSPIEPPSGTVRSPFGNPNGLGGMSGVSSSARLGAGSPSHELGSRLYSKRSVCWLLFCTSVEFADRFHVTVLERFKRKRDFLLQACGVHLPVEDQHPLGKPYQNHRVRMAFQISFHHLKKPRQFLNAELEQAPYLLELVMVTLWVI